MTLSAISHKFVEYIPTELEEGVLYISITHKTASHLCACGCGFRAVTPIRPAQWQLLFDGEAVSLFPSIGNHQFPCRSHYFIRNGRIKWEESWSEERAEQVWRRDDRDLAGYYAAEEDDERQLTSNAKPPVVVGFMTKLREALRRRRRSS